MVTGPDRDEVPVVVVEGGTLTIASDNTVQ